ncbi:Endo-1,3(4)-beta-glucanase [Quillaja saponaria]|uniref:glucan endo-1,3-beta-D-glucosidase n=1 Tax=Quillaja saponaria TaxID=32244 RepID=A0AAD7Q760_QUISA|nr:Endo-1,3(4)-beta-glucanase [Quillaja saponaria]
MSLIPPPTTPFLFPQAHSTVLPDPSNFFSQNLLSNPLPTNTFFQNFVLENGDRPEYIHPYLVKSSNSSLAVSFPALFFNASLIFQIFNPDLTISASKKTGLESQNRTHKISDFSDLSVTLDIPSSNLRFFLVRGSPFLTAAVNGDTELSIVTNTKILKLSTKNSLTKYKISLKNGQTWLMYTSNPIKLKQTQNSIVTSSGFSGIIRIAILPDSDPKYEAILDRFSSCYPISGNAIFKKETFSLEYKWIKKGRGDLLMLAHPLHLQLFSKDYDTTVLKDFKYKSIDGDLVGVVGDSWVLKTDPIPVTWNSIGGIEEESFAEIISALSKDVEALNSIAIMNTTSSYFYGKLVGRAARLALIAEEVHFLEVIPAIRKFLKETIEPWLDGTFSGNGFLYDRKWGGLITKKGSNDSAADFGFGIFNDHHFHLGYYIYGIAVLTKIDPAWGRKYKPQAYSLVTDFMNLGNRSNSNYPRLRCFDLYKLHSWAAGLTEFENGRNQESSSEAVNGYYSAALMGLAYGDTNLVALGSTLTALEIRAAQTWWHVKEENDIYEEEGFTRNNRVVGILWANMRDSKLFFATAECRECRLGIQVLPLSPITEVVYSDVDFAKELVKWTLPLKKNDVEESWKGFIYALQGLNDQKGALNNIRKLKGFDDGNSLTNLLWWIHSRGGE